MPQINVRNILHQLRISQIEAASLVGVSQRAIRYYVSGERRPPTPIAKLLRLLASGKITRRDLALCLRDPL